MQDDIGIEPNSCNSLSYVNISSSVLREKFEKTRKKNMQELIEKNNINDTFVLNKSHTTRLTLEEHENKICEMLIHVKSIENDLKNNTATCEILLKNTTIEEKISELTVSIKDISEKLSIFSLKSEFVECSENIKMLKSSIQEIFNKLENFSIKINEIEKFDPAPIIESVVQEKMDTFSKLFDNEKNNLDFFFKMVIDNTLPSDFFWEDYISLNEDLIGFDEFSAKKHYILYGKTENRYYLRDTNTIPKDFSWMEYLQMNIDISKELKSKQRIEHHYLNNGRTEKRMYKMSQLEEVTHFVYSGRKSGSSTLNDSFLNLENTLSIQIHNNEDFLYKYGQCKFDSIFDLIDNNSKLHKNIYIFDSYRTPIEKKISSFFEDIDKYIPNYIECDISFLIAYFNRKYIFGKNCSNIYTEDYEPLDEILEHYKLSPISKFDFEKNYTIIRHKNFVFVKLRFREINQWSEMISKILGRPISIKDKNKSENKIYYDVYNNFKKQYKIPKIYLEKLKKDPRFNTYNSKLERTNYIKEWSFKSE